MTTRPAPQDRPTDQPGHNTDHPRRGLLRRTALAAAALAGASGLMLAVPGIASANTVDYTTAQWAEIGPLAYTGDQASQVTAVYTIQNVAETSDGHGSEMLEDNGNNMNYGGTIDVWTRYNQGGYQDSMNTSAPQITQANYLWEFVPDNPANGPSITDGPGELINRQSGLCLDVANNNTGDGAAIDQWGCNGGANQQWGAVIVPGTSNYSIFSTLDSNYSGFLGVGNGSGCTTSGDGDPVYVRTTGIANNHCDQWDIQQASYDFATHEITVPATDTGVDNRAYQCITGDTLRVNPNWATWNSGHISAWDYDSLGQATPSLSYQTTNSTPPNYVPSETLLYNQDPTYDGPMHRAHHHTHRGFNHLRVASHHAPKLSAGNDEQTAQIMLYCDPATTSP